MSSSNTRIIHGKSANIKLITDDVLEIDIHTEEFDVDGFKDILVNVEKIGAGKKFKNLILLNPVLMPTSEARDFVTSDEGIRFSLAHAFVTASLAHKIIGNFIIRVQKAKIPIKIFNNRKDALDWLDSID